MVVHISERSWCLGKWFASSTAMGGRLASMDRVDRPRKGSTVDVEQTVFRADVFEVDLMAGCSHRRYAGL
jgi:hypothetical protein